MISGFEKLKKSPFRKDVEKYLCDGYSPREICKWIKTQTDNEDLWLSESYIKKYKKEYCPNVPWNRKKLVQDPNKKPTKKPPKPTKQKSQTQPVKKSSTTTKDEVTGLALELLKDDLIAAKNGDKSISTGVLAQVIGVLNRCDDTTDASTPVEDVIDNDEAVSIVIKGSKYDK